MLAALEHFAPHHRELKQRLIKSFVAIILTTAAAYLLIDQIVAFCMQPLFHAYPDLQKLVYTKLTEAFITYLKLSLLVGIIISFPFILYQIWMFVSPGLLDHERRLVRIIIFWSTFLFAGGALFAFFIALPRILTFFMSYAGPNLEPLPKLGKYLTFVARTVLAFGIAFEIPFLMFMTTWTGLVSRTYFKKNRLYCYIAIVVLAFLLSAGEIVATVLLSFPLVVLYEAGLLLAKIFARDKKKKPE
ncbi:MAG: twin-arginine translocase subunit TatC [Desulfobulbaceae bacterium]|nr:twin-arginine translocase subunit TatC [Desulfobulbaceae bacterium]